MEVYSKANSMTAKLFSGAASRISRSAPNFCASVVRGIVIQAYAD